MKIGEQTITFNKQELTLNTQRSIYWKDQKTLILSDLHLGKAAHFRKHGIAIPMDTAITDLTRLESNLNITPLMQQIPLHFGLVDISIRVSAWLFHRNGRFAYPVFWYLLIRLSFPLLVLLRDWTAKTCLPYIKVMLFRTIISSRSEETNPSSSLYYILSSPGEIP